MAPARKINGRKRHLLTDALGLPLRLVVHPANVQDRDGLGLVCARVHERCPRLQHLFAVAVAARERLRLEIVKRPRDANGFHLLPRRRRDGTVPVPSGMEPQARLCHRAQLRHPTAALSDRPQPLARQGLRGANRCHDRHGGPRHHPTARPVPTRRIRQRRLSTLSVRRVQAKNREALAPGPVRSCLRPPPCTRRARAGTNAWQWIGLGPGARVRRPRPETGPKRHLASSRRRAPGPSVHRPTREALDHRADRAR